MNKNRVEKGGRVVEVEVVEKDDSSIISRSSS